MLQFLTCYAISLPHHLCPNSFSQTICLHSISQITISLAPSPQVVLTHVPMQCGCNHSLAPSSLTLVPLTLASYPIPTYPTGVALPPACLITPIPYCGPVLLSPIILFPCQRHKSRSFMATILLPYSHSCLIGPIHFPITSTYHPILESTCKVPKYPCSVVQLPRSTH